MKLEKDISEEDIKNKDLVITMGGSHTYLKSTSFIKDCNTPILAVDTQASQEIASTLGNKLNHLQAEKDSVNLIRALDSPETR